MLNFTGHIDAEADPVQDLLTRRAENGELSEAEATRRLRTFHADRIERRLRQLMALFDIWKSIHFPNFVENHTV